MHQPPDSQTLVAAEKSTRESIEFTDDGVVLPAMVYRPQLSGRRPAVLLAPGSISRGTIASIEWLATRLAREGYLALTITWRGNVPVEDDRDVALAMDWLVCDPSVDAGRLAMAGHSRGGNTALRIAAHDSRLRAVVALAPPTDLAHNFRATKLYSPVRYASFLAAGYPDPDEDQAFFGLVSGISYADRISCPVLLVHGEGDMYAPAVNSQQMEQALRQAGNDRVRLEIIPGMGHFFELTTQGYQFDRIGSLVVDWLDAVLDPRP